MKYFLYFASLFYSFLSFSQDADSLLKVLKATREDTSKIVLLNDITWAYLGTGEYETAMKYAVEAQVIGEKLALAVGDSLKGFVLKRLANTYNNIGRVYYYRGEYDKALEFHFKSLKARENAGDKKGMAMSYNNIGIIHTDKGNYDKALEYCTRSFNIQKELGNKKGMSYSSNSIGIIYYNKGNAGKI